MEYETREQEAREEALYQEVAGKQNAAVRKIFLWTFGGIGVLFLVLSFFLYILGVQGEDGFSPALILAPMGAFWTLLGVILYAAVPSQSSYENYKKRSVRTGGMNTIDLCVKLEMQRRRISELEARVLQLEKKL